MSPGVGLSIRLATAPDTTPRVKVLAAVSAARARGIPLRNGEAGVIVGQRSRELTIDRRSLVRGVDPVGAILLAHQPAPHGDEDLSAAAARAIGVQLAWIEGLADGWQMIPMNMFWTQSANNCQHYTNGFMVGVEAAIYATKVCRCGVRRWRSESSCPGCDR